MKKSCVLILGLLIIYTSLYSETFLISIYTNYSLSAIVVTSEKGRHRIVADNREIFIMEENDLLYASIRGDKLFISSQHSAIGVFSTVSISVIDDGGIFSLRPVKPSMERLYYYGSLDLSFNYGHLRMINAVSEDLYLCGVIEAESGIRASLTFYQAHAIICRTYLYGNLQRHADEGFYLCDDVHCQVYKGRQTNNQLISEAVNTTSGKVIAYGDIGLITAAFHSNCGGQTVNSEDVWLVHRPYLRSVVDPYCRERRNAVWHTKIDAGEWESYLTGMGFKNNNSPADPGLFAFSQPRRTVFYNVNGVTVPLVKIRSDWNLRSAYFNIEVSNPSQQLLINGKGYGHGVGLCQEGAMEMAAKGYDFADILLFYYKDVKVTDISELF